jgi:hypothetical protein
MNKRRQLKGSRKALAAVGCLACFFALASSLYAQDKPGVVQAFEAKKEKTSPPATPPVSKYVTTEISTVPAVGATIHFGRKKLGSAPLKTRFKRNSGPVDIVIRAPGYFRVNTRIFTHTDSSFAVKLTPLTEANTLFGYKEEIPPDAGVIPADAGVSPAPASPPAASPVPATTQSP